MSHSQRMLYCVVVGMLCPVAAKTARAVPVPVLTVGTLQTGTNYEFQSFFGKGTTGSEYATAAVYSNNIEFKPGGGGATGEYVQSTNPSFTFDFSFSVTTPATLSQTAANVTAEIPGSTVYLMQGTTVIDTLVPTTNAAYNAFVYYLFPTVSINPFTQYDFIVTGPGIPSTQDPGVAYAIGGLVSFDLSAATATTPEPGTLSLIATGLLGIVGLRSRREIQVIR